MIQYKSQLQDKFAIFLAAFAAHHNKYSSLSILNKGADDSGFNRVISQYEYLSRMISPMIKIFGFLFTIYRNNFINYIS